MRPPFAFSPAPNLLDQHKFSQLSDRQNDENAAATVSLTKGDRRRLRCGPPVVTFRLLPIAFGRCRCIAFNRNRQLGTMGSVSSSSGVAGCLGQGEIDAVGVACSLLGLPRQLRFRWPHAITVHIS